MTRIAWFWRAGGLVCLGVLFAGPVVAHAESRRERLGLELRLGGQAPRNFPELAVYAAVGFTRDWSAVLGYELLRTYGVWLPKSCPTTVSPAIVSELRAGVARRVPLRYGFGLRGAALLGVAAPALSPGPFPAHTSGAVFDLALDLAATWTWRVLEVSLFLDATYGVGQLSSHVCATAPRVGARVSEVGALYGLGLAVRL
jgi:hypothetical protein